ncbi:RBBP9/YdeN family alpha/beta hydrolase [Amycolatopsis pithecellobii]|uniref:Alpha/beta fold hydrolase n=1 Tax=Amycolatopsis pithecellobii TaxID=664692 RepID=A0A6N7YU59_9PSEU|nr:alpha/beta hydrolase [Amycolatopsis pithecellobii]MTD56587.1 alpha/beta fold hydrolase [Amycolatopsis pithecellobii]
MIIVPGWGGSGGDHWQSCWLRDRCGAVRVEQRDWERPDRDEWVAELDDTVRRAAGPVVLVAHSLGCHTVAHWAHRHDAQVRAALLVAPPDIGYSASRGAPIAGFGPPAADPLPFPTVLAASSTDPWAEIDWSRMLANQWGARFVALGDAGHVNTEAGFGPWPQGEELLRDLLAETAD